MKVYCKNCRYYKFVSSVFLSCSYHYCKYVLGEKSNWKTEYNDTVGNPEDQNKLNNCKYYKRSWYKFWVKEKIYEAI